MTFQSIELDNRYRPLFSQLRLCTVRPAAWPLSLRATPLVSRSKMAMLPLAVPLARRSPRWEKRMQTACPELRRRAVSVSGMSAARRTGSVRGRFMVGGSEVVLGESLVRIAG